MQSVIFTCDKYMKAVLPFLAQYEKYWVYDRPDVLIVGYQPPTFNLPGWAKFTSMGEDRGVNEWSTGVLKFLNSTSLTHFILFLEDYWFTKPVREKEVRILWDYTINNPQILKMDLRRDRRCAGPEYVERGIVSADYIPLVKSKPNSPYHMSLMTGIFSKRHLLNVLRPSQSPWDVEINGTHILSSLGDNAQVFGTDSWTDDEEEEPISHVIALRNHNHHDLQLDGMSPEDQEAVQKLWKRFD